MVNGGEVRQSLGQGVQFRPEGLPGSIAAAVIKRDGRLAGGAGHASQQTDERRDADPSRHEDDWKFIAQRQREDALRRPGRQDVADADVRCQMTGDRAGVADRHPIRAGLLVPRSGQRIGASLAVEAHGQILTGQVGRERATVRVLERKTDDAVCFDPPVTDDQILEAVPRSAHAGTDAACERTQAQRAADGVAFGIGNEIVVVAAIGITGPAARQSEIGAGLPEAVIGDNDLRIDGLVHLYAHPRLADPAFELSPVALCETFLGGEGRMNADFRIGRTPAQRGDAAVL